MPDHVHLILNPVNRDISVVMRRLKSTSARLILDRLRADGDETSLRKLALTNAQAKSHTHALWQKEFSSIDLYSSRFIQQKLNYVHLNPVRGKLCSHPAEWKWSRYRAYLPHASGEVPIELIGEAIGNRKSLFNSTNRRATPASKQGQGESAATPAFKQGATNRRATPASKQN